MIAKNKRLNLRLKENLDILREAQRVYDEFFTLYYSFDNKPTQVATTISKKVEKLAANRNRIKRQVYSILERIIDERDLWRKNAKIILVVKKKFTRDFEEMFKKVEKMFNKANL